MSSRKKYMNEQTDESERSPWDFILFGVTFLGFVTGAAGIVIDSVCGCLTGLFLMAVGLIYFTLRPSD